MRNLWLSPLRLIIESINDLMDFAEKSVKEHWFVTFSIGYWVVLALFASFWLPYYYVLTQLPFGQIIGVALIFAIPVVLFSKRALIHARASGRLTTKRKSINTRLSDQHYKYLVGYVHKQQIDVFHDVVLVSLNMYYNAMNKVEYSVDDHGISKTLFDLKFTQTVRLFEKILKLPEFRVKSQINPKKCNAIFCFAFFRVFFNGLVEGVSQNQESSLCAKTLISHIPYQFVLHLGSQNWRLYEFHNVCYGDLKALTINDDIFEALIELTSSVKTNTEASNPTDETSTQDETQTAESTDNKELSVDEKNIEDAISAIKKELREQLKLVLAKGENNPGIYYIDDEQKYYVVTTKYYEKLLSYLDNLVEESQRGEVLADSGLIHLSEPFEICIDDLVEQALRLKYRPRMKGLDETIIEAEILS